MRKPTNGGGRQRLARLLVALYEQSRGAAQDLKIALSCEELSQMTGTTLYTVSRTLSRWEQEGIVESGRERVLIRSPHALVTIAEDLPPPGKG